MDTDDSATHVAEQLAALGAPIRLLMVRVLVRAGDAGLPVGELQRRLQLAASTHAHHLAALVRAGLIRQRRQGREVICTAQFPVLRALGTYLTDQCCVDARPNIEAT